jgi:isovaleryl-CoA dehydrogenase
MSIPFAPQSMEFGLGENADMIRDTTARWAADKLAPRAAGIDEKNEFARDLWPKWARWACTVSRSSEEDGGLGLGYLEHVIARKRLRAPRPASA